MRFYEIITEARDYMSMFNSMIDNWPDEWRKPGMTQSVNHYIKRAKSVLGRLDRITWFLLHVKYNILENYIISREEGEEVPPWIQKQFNKLKSRFGYSPSLDLFFPTFDLEDMLSKLEHYMSLPANNIQNYVFENQDWKTLERDLENAEHEWKKSLKGDGVPIQSGDKKLIDLGDMAWWMLSRGACSAEAESMGHCGNQPSEKPGDRIVSLRSKTSNQIWKPHLTFIMDKNGYFGEMKGRGNKKPSPKYHSHIAELLKHDVVKGIKGGGYMPETNFSVYDLPDDTRDELINMKPELRTMGEMLEKLPNDDFELRTRVLHEFDKHVDKKSVVIDEKSQTVDGKIITQSHNSVKDFIADYNSELAQQIDFDHWEYNKSAIIEHITSENVSDMFEEMNPRQIKTVVSWMKKNIPSAGKQLDDDITDPSRWTKFIRFYDQLRPMLHVGLDCLVNSIKQNIDSNMEQMLKDQMDQIHITPGKIEYNQNKWPDTPVRIVMDLDTVIGIYRSYVEQSRSIYVSVVEDLIFNMDEYMADQIDIELDITDQLIEPDQSAAECFVKQLSMMRD